ncbi:MAG TPA: LLM class flavin-dependent oxidoreductase [Acidimicrobiales bacterium]|nr:LLM class flavin-dependent oxidoreductase [Acidimicrobiales bacterium]
MTAAEFIGMILTNNSSESRTEGGPVVDPDFTSRFARAHEAAGFDRVLVGYFSFFPDGFQVAAYTLHETQRLGVLLAHRPGFVAPTVAARQFATLDQFSGGRLAMHTISGANDDEQARDGDFSTKPERYRRTDEYLTVLRRYWTAEEPFDFDGEFYKLRQAYTPVKCFQSPHIPIYFGGSSDEALAVSARHADVYAQWGEPLAETAEHIGRVQALAAREGRHPRISLSTRPIVAATDDEALDRAYAILRTVQDRRPGGGVLMGNAMEQGVGSQRLLAAAKKGDILDRCLFMPLATATGAAGNSTALVGSPATVAAALLDYYDVGVTTFLMRGYDPLADIDTYADVIGRVHEGVARRQAAAAGPVGA